MPDLSVITLDQLRESFAQHGFEVGADIAHLYESGLLGGVDDSPLYPWSRPFPEECVPIGLRFPKSKPSKDLIIFARRQDWDHYGCVERTTGHIVEVHYDPPNPRYLSLDGEFDDAWAWFRSVVGDLEAFWRPRDE